MTKSTKCPSRRSLALYRFRRNTHDCGSRHDVTDNGGSGTDNRIGANNDIVSDSRTNSYPCSFADSHASSKSRTGADMYTISQIAVMIDRRRRIDDACVPDAREWIDDSVGQNHTPASDLSIFAHNGRWMHHRYQVHTKAAQFALDTQPLAIVADGNAGTVEFAASTPECVDVTLNQPCSSPDQFRPGVVEENDRSPATSQRRVRYDPTVSTRSDNRNPFQ